MERFQIAETHERLGGLSGCCVFAFTNIHLENCRGDRSADDAAVEIDLNASPLRDRRVDACPGLVETRLRGRGSVTASLEVVLADGAAVVHGQRKGQLLIGVGVRSLGDTHSGSCDTDGRGRVGERGAEMARVELEQRRAC